MCTVLTGRNRQLKFTWCNSYNRTLKFKLLTWLLVESLNMGCSDESLLVSWSSLTAQAPICRSCRTSLANASSDALSETSVPSLAVPNAVMAAQNLFVNLPRKRNRDCTMLSSRMTGGRRCRLTAVIAHAAFFPAQDCRDAALHVSIRLLQLNLAG